MTSLTYSTEKYSHLFEGIIGRPSFLNIANIDPDVASQNLSVYQSVVSSKMDEVIEISKNVGGPIRKNPLFSLFAPSIFGSSEASETRFLVAGLKPAVRTNCGGKFQDNWQKSSNDYFEQLGYHFDFKDYYPFSVVIGVNYSFEPHRTPCYVDEQPYDVLYNPDLVKEVIKRHRDIFQELGYSVTDPHIVMQKAHDKEDIVAQSLLLGYPLETSILFEFYNRMVNDALPEAPETYWRRVLSKEQFQFLDGLELDVGNELRRQRTPQSGYNVLPSHPRYNEIYQLWESADMHEFLREWITIVYGKEFLESSQISIF